LTPSWCQTRSRTHVSRIRSTRSTRMGPASSSRTSRSSSRSCWWVPWAWSPSDQGCLTASTGSGPPRDGPTSRSRSTSSALTPTRPTGFGDWKTRASPMSSSASAGPTASAPTPSRCRRSWTCYAARRRRHREELTPLGGSAPSWSGAPPTAPCELTVDLGPNVIYLVTLETVCRKASVPLTRACGGGSGRLRPTRAA
jgi:hypothetical protein